MRYCFRYTHGLVISLLLHLYLLLVVSYPPVSYIHYFCTPLHLLYAHTFK